jgi:membrane fusion protein (multidrug efflux system)
MFVDVDLVLDVREDSILIPKRALVYDSDQIFIFRVKTNDANETRAERVLLQPELMDKNNVEPGPEVQADDMIVIAGQTGLKDGALVEILGAESNAASETEEVSGESDELATTKVPAQ